MLPQMVNPFSTHFQNRVSYPAKAINVRIEGWDPNPIYFSLRI
jgi:hypothetical protein